MWEKEQLFKGNLVLAGIKLNEYNNNSMGNPVLAGIKCWKWFRIQD